MVLGIPAAFTEFVTNIDYIKNGSKLVRTPMTAGYDPTATLLSLRKDQAPGAGSARGTKAGPGRSDLGLDSPGNTRLSMQGGAGTDDNNWSRPMQSRAPAVGHGHNSFQLSRRPVTAQYVLLPVADALSLGNKVELLPQVNQIRLRGAFDHLT